MNSKLVDVYDQIRTSNAFMPHQLGALDWTMHKFYTENLSTLLMYHKPGTGKTHIGSLIYLVCASAGIPTYIIVPNRGLGVMWENTIMSLYSSTNLYRSPETYTKTAFSTILSNMVNRIKDINLSDSLIIIDEAHEIFESDITSDIINVRNTIKGLKVLLMTGTPIPNTPKTLISMLKLLTNKEYSGLVDYGSYVYEIKIKDKFKQMLLKDLSGLVSYFDYSESNVAKIKEETLHLYMKKEQYDIYKQTKSIVSNEMFQQILSNVSLFAIKGLYSVEMIKQLQPGTVIDDFMYNELIYHPMLSNLNLLEKRSCKMHYFFDGLINHKFKDKVFVYLSNPFYGSLIMKSVFKAFQITEYGTSTHFTNPICFCGYKKSAHHLESTQLSAMLRVEKYQCPHKKTTFRPMCYVLITSNTITDPTYLIDRFNMDDNTEGEHIKIMIGSNIISVGYTLKEVKSIHLISLPTNKNEEQQIVKRAIRLYAHKDPNTVVYLYRYLAVIHGEESYDSKKLEYTKEKYNNTLEVESILISSSKNIKENPHPILHHMLRYEIMRQLFISKQSTLKELNNRANAICSQLSICSEVPETDLSIVFDHKAYYIENDNYKLIKIPYQKFVLYNTIDKEISNFVLSYSAVIKKRDTYYYALPSKQLRVLQSFSKEHLDEIYTRFASHLNITPSQTDSLKKEELVAIIISMVKGTKYLIIYGK